MRGETFKVERNDEPFRVELNDLIASGYRLRVDDFQEMCMRDFARLMVQAEFDPLPKRELGEVFSFKLLKKWVPIEGVEINVVVPLPNADLDLFEALREFEKDVEHCRLALERARLSIADLNRIIGIMWEWFRFMSLRHPEADARRVFGEAAFETDKAVRLLVRRMCDFSKEVEDEMEGDGDAQVQ